MKTRFTLPLSLLLFSSAGCDRLLSDPGRDFGARVTTAPAAPNGPVMTLHQQASDPELAFEVDDCKNASATVQVAGGTETPLHVIEAMVSGDDAVPSRYRATAPVDAFHDTDEYCLYDVAHPMISNVTLKVRCDDDGRETTTQFQTSWAPAWRATYRGRGPSDGILPSATPGVFYDVGSGWLEQYAGGATALETPAGLAASQRPLLATSGDAVFLHAGCPINDCGPFWILDTPTEKIGTGGGLLQVFTFAGGRADFVRNVTVPTDATDVVADPDGTVTLITELSSDVVLTRVVGEKATATELAGERLPTRFVTSPRGRVFLDVLGDDRARLHAADGATLREVAIPGSGGTSYVSLAPDASAFVAFRGGRAYLVPLDPPGAATALDSTLDGLTQQTAEDSSFGAAWTAQGVALRNRSRVEVFARTAPYARRWNLDAKEPSVIGALALGDSLVVQTQRGLEIFDADGRLTGGAEPFPAACGVDFEPRHAAVVAPDVVALSGKRAVYELKATLP